MKIKTLLDEQTMVFVIKWWKFVLKL